MQRIIFVGNCQIQAIHDLFRRFAWHPGEQALTYVPAYEAVDEAAAAEIARADLIVEQVFDTPPKAEIDGLNDAARRVFVPLAGGNFLWPFSGVARPHNPVRPFLSEGIFPREAGISFLTRMILDGVDPEQAVDAFMNYDVAAHINLDRSFKISIDLQRRRDQLTGFELATLIEQHFREERLFLTPFHPDTRLALELATVTFERMDVDAGDIERMRRATRQTPLPSVELPIHPAVIRHFGLRYLPEEPRFAFLNEGRLTFREIALRYMRCEWNEPLEHGIHLVQSGDLLRGEPLLVKGLARSPDSATGHAMLGRARRQLGRSEEAVAALDTAVRLNPDDPRAWSDLALALQASGAQDGAEKAFRRAVQLDPYDAHLTTLLAHFLQATGRVPAAAEAIEAGLANDDRSAKLHLEMGIVREAQADWAAAVQSYETALRLDPTLPAHDRLAAALTRAGRAAGAAAVRGAAETAQKAETGALLAEARALRDAGAWQRVESLSRQALAREPDNIDGALLLAEALANTDDLAQAVAVLKGACQRHPDHRGVRLALGEHLLHLGDPGAAAAAFEAALELARDGHSAFLLMRALESQGRMEAAIRAGQDMVQLDPQSAHRYLQLAEVQLGAGDGEGAQASLRRALELAPEDTRFLRAMSERLMEAGLAAEAARTAREAVRLAPDDPVLREHLARQLAQVGELDEARLFLVGAASPVAPRQVNYTTNAQSGYDEPLSSSGAVVVFDGDSISAGAGAEPGHGLDASFMPALGVPARLYNVAAAGRPVIDCLIRFDQVVRPLRNAEAALNLIVFHAGDNDIAMRRTSGETYEAVTRYVELAHRNGWKIVISTAIPRPDFGPLQRAVLAAYNRLLLDNAAGADAVVDFSQDPRFGEMSQRDGSPLFADPIHPNAAGYAILGRLLATATQPLLKAAEAA